MKKKTVLKFQATNKQNLSREDLGMAKKWKILERNWISSNISTKQRHKDKQR